MNRNYDKELQEIEKAFQQGRTPSLLLHACCAPCSSYVLERLSRFFSITLLFYNPNISPAEEYKRREKELRRLVCTMPLQNPVSFAACDYRPEAFSAAAKGIETLPEGGARCLCCYRLRLEEAAKKAAELDSDYFTTTLSISPMKKSSVLNALGEEIGANYGVRHLPCDFKKRGGYQRSIVLSKEYGLYRQDYCGCAFSKAEREQKNKQPENPEGQL